LVYTEDVLTYRKIQELVGEDELSLERNKPKEPDWKQKGSPGGF
jgi:hypothetical protein